MPTRVVALANQKGGVGKTTTAVNLAAGLALRRLDVLLVDIDPQCNATSGIGVEREEGKSVYGSLLGDYALSSVIKSTKIKHLDIVPSELDLAGAEIDVARSERYLHRFREALAPILDAGIYNFVIVDCPPSLGILTMNALCAADSVLIPLQCEYYALEGLSVISRLIEQVRTGGTNPGIELEGILMTMRDSRTKLSSDVIEEVRRHFADDVYKTVIPRNVRLSEAPSFGMPAIEYDAHSTGAEAYRQFVREFLKRVKERSKSQGHEDRGERSEVRGQKSEDRGAGVGSQEPGGR